MKKKPLPPPDREDADFLLRIIADINAATGEGADEETIGIVANEIRSMEMTAALLDLWKEGTLIVKGINKDGETQFVKAP